MGGDGRDDGDGDGRNQRAGQVEHGLPEVVDALEVLHVVLHQGRRAGEAAHIDHGVDQVDDLQSRRADGDGNGDGQQLTHGRAGGLGGTAGGQGPAGLAVAPPEVEGRDHTAHGDTENRAARAQGQVAGEAHDQQGQAQTDEELAQGLKDLADRGGGHVALALEKAPEGRDNADKQHRRSQGGDGGPGGVVGGDHHRQLAAEDQHSQAAYDAQDQEDPEGRAENLADLGVVAQGPGLGGHAAHGHGEACGGDHQQHRVEVVGRGEVAVALVVDDTQQGDFIDRADDLDNDGGGGQHGRAL